eukprot:3954331-Pleurochrysis_carterae.AAC.1
MDNALALNRGGTDLKPALRAPRTIPVHLLPKGRFGRRVQGRRRRDGGRAADQAVAAAAERRALRRRDGHRGAGACSLSVPLLWEAPADPRTTTMRVGEMHTRLLPQWSTQPFYFHYCVWTVSLHAILPPTMSFQRVLPSAPESQCDSFVVRLTQHIKVNNEERGGSSVSREAVLDFEAFWREYAGVILREGCLACFGAKGAS